MTIWQKTLDGLGTFANVGQFEIFIAPNRPSHGYNAMILAFNHVVHRVNRDTIEDGQRRAIDDLIGFLDEWKEQAEQARQELNEVQP